VLVKDIMTEPAKTCRITALLGDAARIMFEEGCGCLPVIDARGHLAGMITDRDICLAVAERRKSPWEIPVRDVMTTKVFAVAPGDHIDAALVAMKEHRVRRIPVVNDKGMLKGLLSVDDLIRNTGLARGRLAADAVVDVLRHVCTPKLAPGDVITA